MVVTIGEPSLIKFVYEHAAGKIRPKRLTWITLSKKASNSKSMVKSLSSDNIIFEPYPKQEEFIGRFFPVNTRSCAMAGRWVAVSHTFQWPAPYCWLSSIPGRCGALFANPFLPSKPALEHSGRFALNTLSHLTISRDMTVTFNNGSQILFMAEDYANDKDFDRFKGLEVNGFIPEQIEELKRRAVRCLFYPRRSS